MAKDNVKEVRKQLKNVAKELMPEIFKTEAVEAMEQKLLADQDNKLKAIEDFVSKELTRQDKRAKDILGFIMREVKFTISNQLHNANITMLAWQELMQERLAIPAEEFNEALDAKKLEIDKRLSDQAQVKQQADIQAAESTKLQALEQAKAAANESENKGPAPDAEPSSDAATTLEEPIAPAPDAS